MDSFAVFLLESEQEDTQALKQAVMIALGATEDGLREKISSFDNYKKLLDAPAISEFLKKTANPGDIKNAIENAANTELSIVDLLSLFTTGFENKLNLGKERKKTPKKPTLSKPPEQTPSVPNAPPTPQAPQSQDMLKGIG